MTAEIFELVMRAAIAVGIATGIVLISRGMLRRRFGPQIAYGAWVIVPIALLASLLPAELVIKEQPATVLQPGISALQVNGASEVVAATPATAAEQSLAVTDAEWGGVLKTGALGVWAVGAVLGFGVLLVRQRRFLQKQKVQAHGPALQHARDSHFGPAVVGVLKQKIILPSDFAVRFSRQERALVLAHENAHVRRGDVRMNALAALIKSLNWFNPLVYLAQHKFREDQEMACDARVMERHGKQRKLYAETLLKSQLMSQAAPIGCGWLPEAMNPLKARVASLAAPSLSGKRRAAGAVALLAASSVTGVAAWAALATGTVEFEAAAEPRVQAVVQSKQEGLSEEEAQDIAEVQGRMLVEVILEGNTRQARALVKAGADVNYFQRGDGTPLLIAAGRGEKGLVNLLLEAGADPNVASPSDGNALIAAVRGGHDSITALLLEAGADPDGYVRGDETPLIAAAKAGDMKLTNLLLQAGADANLRVETGNRPPRAKYRSPLGQALYYGHDDVAALLRRHGATDPVSKED